jgi:DNA-binding XRE family transcriptional regulator/predicted RNase H-like HicB family nuclease
MRYPAFIDFDGDRIVAEFPDCPGCQATADPDQDIVAIATPVLQRWLGACLVDGTIPPKPSAAVVTRDWVEWVSIPPDLARRLLLRWAAMKRISRAELARRAGVSEAALATLEDDAARPSAKVLDGVARALGVLDITGAPPAPARPRTAARTASTRRR